MAKLKRHSPAGAAHRAGYSLSEMRKAASAMEKLHGELKALNKAAGHVKGGTLKRKVTKSGGKSSGKGTSTIPKRATRSMKPDYTSKGSGHIPYRTKDRIR